LPCFPEDFAPNAMSHSPGKNAAESSGKWPKTAIRDFFKKQPLRATDSLVSGIAVNKPQDNRRHGHRWLPLGLALSPTLVFTLAIISFAFALYRTSAVGLDDPAFFPRLQLLVPLLVPLLLGIGAAWIAVRIRAPKLERPLSRPGACGR